MEHQPPITNTVASRCGSYLQFRDLELEFARWFQFSWEGTES